MEDNEWFFCSMWTERFGSGCADALINSKLEGDYFFNRARVSDCSDPVAAALKIAKTFWQRGLDCYLHDRDSKLAGHGFTKIDLMNVLRPRSSYYGAGDSRIVLIDRPTLPLWIDLFCRSFGVTEWMPEVEKIMNANFDKIDLLVLYRNEVPSGCAALYTKNGMTGLYCLGILPQMRKKGLANNIVATAVRLHNNLFVQTFDTEGLLPFYEKAGFTVSYSKKIYVLRRPTKLSRLKNRVVK